MFELTERTAYSYLAENAKARPFALACLTETDATTWSQSKEIVNSLIKRLHEAGVTKGSFVALRATKCKEIYHLYLALLGIGAVIVITDQFKRVDEFIEETKKNVPLAFAITSENDPLGEQWELIDYTHGRVERLNVMKNPFATQAEIDEIVNAVNVHDMAILMFTSGSTGVSKGVMISQYSLVNNAWNTVNIYQCCAQTDVPIILTPLHHIMGTFVLLTHIFAGSPVFLPAKSSPDYVLDCIEKYRVTMLNAVPTLFLAMCELQKQKPRDISSLDHGAIAGGSYSPEQFLYIEKELGMKLFCTYGMTETCTIITNSKFTTPSEERYDNVGEFIPGVEYAFKNTFGKTVEKGKTGEICIKGFNLMLGYYEDEEATKAVMDEEGYFHTGDLGYLDENNHLHIVGRIKDIIIRGGDNLSPAKIENAIASVDGVKYVSVVGAPDDYYGEITCAAVVADGLNESGLKEKLKDKLRKIEIPDKILFLDTLPLNASGKPDKIKIKQLFKEDK